jgi:hypothetical protein
MRSEVVRRQKQRPTEDKTASVVPANESVDDISEK